MTIILGFKGSDFVTITADKKSTHLKGNTILETSDMVKKVFHISENIIIGIAGLNDLGLGINTLLKSIFSKTHKLSVDEILSYVEKTCIYAHSMYKEVHSEGYDALELVVAGLDNKKGGRTYLYVLSSIDNFKPKEFPQYYITPGYSQAYDSLAKSNHINNIVQRFAAAIRTVEDPMVSKESYSISIVYDQERNKYKSYIYNYDADGNKTMLDLDGNEIKV
ncbi:hypothetical protein JN25_05770 [Bacillus sp. BSC154]|nr:hypothetical protein JN25_05770 [Bacillus sp. BSC154]